MVAVTVTRASTTRRIASWINRLPPARYQFSCPALSAVEPVETLTFRASATGSTLATATVTDFGGSSDCNPLILSVPGHKDRRLVGGQIVERVERLLGVNFGIGIGVLKGHSTWSAPPPPRRRELSPDRSCCTWTANSPVRSPTRFSREHPVCQADFSLRGRTRPLLPARNKPERTAFPLPAGHSDGQAAKDYPRRSSVGLRHPVTTLPRVTDGPWQGKPTESPRCGRAAACLPGSVLDQ